MKVIARSILMLPAGIALCFAQIEVSADSMSFTAASGGDPPPEQRLLVVASNPSQSVTFAVRADGGSPDVVAPSWLVFGPRTLTAPAAIRVTVDPAGLTPGTRAVARLLLTTPAGIALGSPIPVNVNVVAGTAQLVVTPDALRFSTRLAASRTLVQDLVVRNTGPGSLQPITVSAKSNVQGLSAAVSSPCDKECLVRVTLERGLNTAGVYQGVVEVKTAVGTREIPVVAHLANPAPALALSPSAVEFEARLGQGLLETRSVSVLNVGEFTANWTAEKMAGGAWLTLDTASGSSTPTAAAPLTFTVDAASTAAGTHYALLKISSSQAPNSPLFLPVVLRVADAPPAAMLSPAGLVFTAAPGSSPPPGAPITISSSSASPILYHGSVQHETGTGWLSLSPTVGSVENGSPATALVSVSTAGLGPGIYQGMLNFWLGGLAIRSLNVTLVVADGTMCAPSDLAVTHLTLEDNFAAQVGDHVPVAVSLTDDCGAPVVDGSAAVNFSNGDRPISLRHLGGGVYSAHWSPLHTGPHVTVAALGTAPRLSRVARALQVGSVSPASSNQPVLAPDATLNNLFPRPGAALAPGTVSQVYGLGLATATAQTPFINGRLPATFNGTTVLTGGIPAPLYYLSDGQLNIQMPYELAQEQPHQILVEVNGAYTVTDTVYVTAATPGVAAFPDGMAIAQHADGVLADSANPAHPGETVVIYLVGMGLTNPPIGTGEQVLLPLRSVLHAPQITLDGVNIIPSFAGLTPFFAGLYQINLPVPASARAGSLKLEISQNGIPANATFLVVR